MQPVRHGATRGCFWTTVLFFALAWPLHLQAQNAIETQQQANEKIKSLSATAASGPHEYIVGKGDLLGVEVFDIPELTRDLRVSQTGTIGLPLVPVRLFVAGLTELQIQQKVSEVLEANGLVSHPQVMVSVKDKRSKPIAVVGAVVHPMVYQADRAVTLVEVLAESGGIAADAGDVVIITRAVAPTPPADEPPEISPDDALPIGNPGNSTAKLQPPVAKDSAGDTKAVFPGPPTAQPDSAQDAKGAPPQITGADSAPLPNIITVNLAELLERGNTQNNIALQGGDVVTIPHAGIVYALGAVAKPGGFVSTGDRSQLSTLKLLALAGGFTRIAKKDRAVIIRVDTTGKQQSIPVDMAKIVERKTEDVRLLPSDILYIPDNAAKAALIRAGEFGLALGSAAVIYRIGTGRF